jgi:hypothetical protein
MTGVTNAEAIQLWMVAKTELIRAIAEEIGGTSVPKRAMAQFGKRLATFQTEFEALTDEKSMAVRDQLVAVAEALKAAARAVGEAPDVFEEIARSETGSGSTPLANTLRKLAERTADRAREFAIPRAQNDPEKKLCAWFAFQLIDELSDQRPTLTPGGTFINVAELVAELFTGSRPPSMTHSSREVIEGRFPVTPGL